MKLEELEIIVNAVIENNERLKREAEQNTAEQALLIAAGEGDAEASFKAMNGNGDNDE